MKEQKNIPHFGDGVMKQDLEEVNVGWEISNMAIKEHRDNVESQ